MLFSPLNFVILAVYLGTMLAIGVVVAFRQKNTTDFFLAGRRMPWPIVAMSMYASLTSAVTFLVLPNIAYSTNISLVAVCVVSPLLAPFLIRIFYPFYERLKITTSYEYVGARFGQPARLTASALYILAQLGWLGTVVYAPALALSAVADIPLPAAILMMGLVATVYTSFGGITADILSDTVQFVIMIVGAVWIAITLVRSVDGGAAGILEAARTAGRLDVFQWPPTLTQMSVFTVALCFFFKMMYEYGADQTAVQRLMTTPTLKGIKRAIIFNAVVDFFIIGLLSFIGIGLLAFYTAYPDPAVETLKSDQRLPYYIIHALPNGVSGLLITAIFAAMMSTMDSGISSLSTVIMNDFIQPFRSRPADEAADLRRARILTFAFGGLATAAAFYFATFETLIEGYMSVISLFNGPILALFLLGMMSRTADYRGWLVGAACSISGTLWLQRSVEANWTFHFPFSFCTAFVVGWLASLCFRPRVVDQGLLMGGSR